MLNTKQIEALKKLMVSPAKNTNAGVAKHHDGTTLNGNIIRSLYTLGFVANRATGETRQATYSGIKHTVNVSVWEITEAGKAAINA